MPASFVVEIPNGTVRTSKVLRLEMWPRSLLTGCSSFVILFENQDDSLNGVFSPQNTVDLKVNNADFMMGYVDTITHLVYDQEDTFRHLLRVSGRDYSQDAMNLIHTESYPYNTRIDDLIDDALNDTGSEITYASGSSESQMAGGYEAKDEFLINILRDCFERESYDGYVNAAKAFQLVDLSNLTASGITLKSVAGAADNNILAIPQPIEYTEADGIPIKNYVKVIGQRVRDGWTDGNAGDWTGAANVSVSNETTIKKVGTASILAEASAPGVGNPDFWLDFSGGLYSKTLNYLDWSIYAQEEMMWWGRGNRTGAGALYCRPWLTDTTGNEIDYYNAWFEGAGMTSGVWYWLGAPLGTECVITAPLTNDRWHWQTNIDGNFNWHIEKLGFYGLGTGVMGNYQDKMYIDDLRLPEDMVSISEHGGSQGSYRKRCMPIRKPYFIQQAELDDFSAAALAVLKDPPEYLKVMAMGTAGIIAGANKWIPATSLTVNIPRLSINAETWRFVKLHHIVEPRGNLDGHGCDFITEVEMVPSTTKLLGRLYDALSSGKVEPQMGRLDERVRAIEKMRSLSHLDVTTRGDESYP